MPVRDTHRRYLLFKLHTTAYPEENQIHEKIIVELTKMYGIKGLSTVNPRLIKYNINTKTGILRCNLRGLRIMRAAIAFITGIEESDCSVEVLRLSGTIKSLGA